MGIAEEKTQSGINKACGLFKFHTSSSHSFQASSSSLMHQPSKGSDSSDEPGSRVSNQGSSLAKSILPKRHRLRIEPNSLFFPFGEMSEALEYIQRFIQTLSFPRILLSGNNGLRSWIWNSETHYEPGKQVRSAVNITNTCKSNVAFKFQTTAPKSCYMRPPGGILLPGASIIATVFKFVEDPETNDKSEQNKKVKFKIMSLKVDGITDYIPEMFDEMKDKVTKEKILQVVFLDPERPSSDLEKLNLLLAHADAERETHKKKVTAVEAGNIIGEGLVIDEWKERREKYLAQQQAQSS